MSILLLPTLPVVVNHLAIPVSSSLHFTSLQVSTQPFAQLQIPHPQQNDPLRTTYYSTIQPQPQSILHLPSRLKQQAKSHSIPHLIAEICETTYSTNHLRTHENIRRGYHFCSMYVDPSGSLDDDDDEWELGFLPPCPPVPVLSVRMYVCIHVPTGLDDGMLSCMYVCAV